MMIDDSSPLNQRRNYLLTDQFDQIGIACNCHKNFQQFCIIELGKNVRPIETNYFTLESAAWPVGLGLDYP